MINCGLAIITAFFVYTFINWTVYKTVSHECDRLGGFYVGKSVFKCERK